MVDPEGSLLRHASHSVSKHSPFASRDPGQGFLDLNEEVVVALRAQSGVRWGAIDFGGESGDVMHFDLRGELEAKRAAAVRALQEAQRASESAEPAATAEPAH